MAAYTFLGFPPNDYRHFVLWSDPAVWSTGVVPNAPDADVVFPAVTYPGSAAAHVDTAVTQSYAIRSLSVTFDEIDPGYISGTGSLAVSGALALNGGAIFNNQSNQAQSAGTLSIDPTSTYDGTGTLTVAGLFDNAGTISLSGASITAGSLTNTGTLSGDGVSVTVTGGAGAFTNLSGGVLTGGTYDAVIGAINLNVGGTIVTDAATIILDSGGTLNAYDSAAGGYDPLQTTLRTIAAGGSLVLKNREAFSTPNTLSVAGNLTLTDSAGSLPVGPTLTTGELDIAGGGGVSGFGTVNGPVVDNGTVTSAVAPFTVNTGGPSGVVNIPQAATLLLNGPVTGSGTLVVGVGDPLGQSGPTGSTLELAGPTTAPVVFTDGTGILKLDNPASFTGTITPAATQATPGSAGRGTSVNDQVVLSGIPLASVAAYSYAGNATGGTLTIQQRVGQTTLSFLGDYTTGSFALGSAAGSGNLDITVTPVPSAPTLTLQSSGGTGKAIVNTTTPVLAGTTQPGTTVSFVVNGAAAGTTAGAAALGATSVGYAAAANPLALGYETVTASASNAAGSAAAPNALNLFVLPSPVSGVTTAPYTSLDIDNVLGQGYGFQFVGGTEALQLTNGTLSVGPDTNQAFVQRLYAGLLGRGGDTAGLGGFNGALMAGAPSAAVAATILNSAEYQAQHGAPASVSDTQYVTSLYQGFLGRTPGQSDLAGWVNGLAQGVTRAQAAVGFAQAPEAKTHLAASTAHVWAPDPNGALVTQLYETGLGRAPDLPGLQGFDAQLAAGVSPLQVAASIATSAEFNADHAGSSAGAFVTSLYQSGLGRMPGAAELQGWVGQLDAGAGSTSVLYGIATSAEAGSHLSPAV